MTLVAIKEQYKRLTLLANAPKDAEQINAWIGMAAKLESQVGERRFIRAVDSCLANLEFFPLPVQLKAHVPAGSNRTGERCTRCEATDGYMGPYDFAHPTSGRSITGGDGAWRKCKHAAAEGK
jgi:hypothetical protein